MFSWSSNRTRGGSSSQTTQVAEQYPGNRARHAPSGSASSATVIQGTIRPPTYTRQQHLESYLQDDTLKKSTRRVSTGADDSTYDTVFQTTAGDTLILRVYFPDGALFPAMTLAGVLATHSWLDANMRVTGYRPILSEDTWQSANLLLGRAVRQVVEHLQLQPPTVVQFTDAQLTRLNKKVTPKQKQGRSPPPPAYQANFPQESVELPLIPTYFEALEDLDRDQLEVLANEELELAAFCNQHVPVCKDLHALAMSVVQENAVQARANLERKEELTRLHKENQDLHEEFKRRVEAFRVLERQQDELCAPPNPKDVMRGLKKAKQEAYRKSEQVAVDWLNGDDCGDNVDSFVKEFLKERKIHHVRAAKLELLEHANR